MLARAVAALLGGLLAVAAHAQTFPAKPIRWIVPFPPGGPADVIARLLGPRLNDNLSQPVIIENRAGGNSNIGHEAAARAAPDGYTILYVVPNVVTNPSLYRGSVDPLKDLAPVAQLTTQSYLLISHPSFGPKTMAEIVALAKTKPGGVTCASGGGLPGFGCEWFRSITQAPFVHVPYKGNAPALNDLIGGQVDILIDLFNTALPQIRAGKARPVALTGPKRGAPLPDLPVVAETLPGFVLVGWHGVMAPVGIPAPIIERLNRAFAEALNDAEVRKRIGDTYIDVSHTTAEAFGRIVQDDFAKYAKIVKEAGIKPE
jgi:tripartite-type tricarboxylate transporter receptor subunit TctC